MQSQSDAGAEAGPLRLPPQCTTVTADDLRVQLVLASDADGEIVVDASDVENVGQAVLQLLVAASDEARRSGQSLAIANPSPAFVQRAASCLLADRLGLQPEEVIVQ